MAGDNTNNPNERQYIATRQGEYLSTRILTHGGTTIAIALRRTKDRGSLYFDYSILDATDDDPTPGKEKKNADPEELDSQHWFDNVKSLRFPSEVRVVGEEAVPVYGLPAVDRSNKRVGPEETEKLDTWLSTSLCLMNPDVTGFEVFSDGKYVYIFRQSRAQSDKFLDQFVKDTTGKPPIDGNLLCDRFTLVGNALSRTLEVRYRRSRQKRLPLNEKDTLAVRDINDISFYEPTFSVGFVRGIVQGRFSVLQTPTVSNGQSKWMIFAYSGRPNEIECFTTDVAGDGLFDIHGQIYYTCDIGHKETFFTMPGACTTLKEHGEVCGLTRKVIVPKMASPNFALLFYDKPRGQQGNDGGSSKVHRIVGMTLAGDEKGIDLSAAPFSKGFALETWICPLSAGWAEEATPQQQQENKLQKISDAAEAEQKPETKEPVKSGLPPPGSKFRLFSFEESSNLNEGSKFSCLFLDDHLRITVELNGADNALATSAELKADAWNHIALTYTAGETQCINLIVNGELSLSGSGQLPANAKFGFLKNILSQPQDIKQRFQGGLDEIRLWSYPLHPSTIKLKMSTRATGMEPFLEACWHLDEGTSTKAFDATKNGHDINIGLENPSEDAPYIWITSTAPSLANVGLSRSTLRLVSGVTVEGGLGASLYYEQVSVIATAASDSGEAPRDQANKKNDHNSKDKKPSKTDPSKPLKRGARVLLSFVASPALKAKSTLAVLDFGLCSDGTLCDLPAIIPLSAIGIVSSSESKKKYAPTSLLHVDGQGMETFGGILDFPAARCSSESPFVWDSATGTVTIFYKNESGAFSALTYDVSRSVKANRISSLSQYPGILAAAKLRQVKDVSIATIPNKLAPQDVAIDLKISASLSTGPVEELWQCVPTNIERLSNLLNGWNVPVKTEIGKLSELKLDKTSKNTFSTYLISLKGPLPDNILPATCLDIHDWRWLVVEEAKKGDTKLVVSYLDTVSDAKKPGAGWPVTSLGYDHKLLVKAKGKPSTDFTSGSTIVTITTSPPTMDTQAPPPTAVIKPDAKALITNNGQCPFFASPAPSSALQLKDDHVYSMLETAVRTPANSGIAFETWVKVNKISESVLVAYTSERSPRSEGLDPEHQTFVLVIPPTTDGKTKYELACNANGTLFSVKDEENFHIGSWIHFACSLHNVLSLRFSGSNYVDLGTATEWNVGDFSVAFTLQLKDLGRDQILFTKSAPGISGTPIHLKITTDNRLCLTFWAENETDSKTQERSFMSPANLPLERDKPYKIFISRKLNHVPKKDKMPRSVQCVTMRAWESNGVARFKVDPPSLQELEDGEKLGAASKINLNLFAEACGPAVGNETPLLLGGAPWTDRGVTGAIGPFRLYSSAIELTLDSPTKFCNAGNSERGLIAAWSFRGGETMALIDDTGRNHGKLKNEPKWMISPFTPDHRLSVYINGIHRDVGAPPNSVLLAQPAGPHQLTLGNIIYETYGIRYLRAGNGFHGEFDELRIWNVPRTRGNFCDTMNARLAEVPADVAVYLPFDVDDVDAMVKSESGRDLGILADSSINCWHLNPLHGAPTGEVVSQAPVGRDASCVQHVHGNMEADHAAKSAKTRSSPSVAEYGEMQIGANGSFEGSYKRAYSFIDLEGNWRLDTGFRIGSLITEWVSQIQTSPTLIGYIEGAPPIPAENYIQEKEKPVSAIKFTSTKNVQYSYGLRTESASDFNLTVNRGIGAEWKVMAGLGVESQVAAGKVKGGVKNTLDISNSMYNNNVSMMKSHTNMDMKMELSGRYTRKSTDEHDIYEPANTGLALVESEVADVFALRLKMRGPIAPLVAYQMRPNPDIPKDRNLVTFPIDKKYTKQGCLDGRYGGKADADYVSQSDAPKDASYYKPVEAYALKERIRRAEEQLAGEYDRYQITGAKHERDLPSRARRNICNSYVWTADGGTFQENHSTMDFIQHEVGGNSSTRIGIGAGLEIELSAGCVLGFCNVDALYSTHVNVMQTKETLVETGFELIADLPPAIDIRKEVDTAGKIASDELVKRDGAVDTYRWMSFWLEPSSEGTDAFFKQVVDPEWLGKSKDPSAGLLRQLRNSLERETGNARTKAWRLLHRVTYVSRVLKDVSDKPNAESATLQQSEKKAAALLADISCNWLLLQKIEPLLRGVQNREGLRKLADEPIRVSYPTIRSEPQLYQQLLELLGDYIGLRE